MTYRIELTKAARKALTESLPEVVAVACWEFIRGPLAEIPYRVGKPLRDRFEGRYSARRGQFRLIYQIFDERVVVWVIHIAPVVTYSGDAMWSSSVFKQRQAVDPPAR